MPLPYFLMMILAVVLAGALTLWVALSAGLSVMVLAMVALSAAAVLHLARDRNGDHDA